jgi:peptidoglycan hydrolase-like protein with peptidoglycan-binding domain/3D (Asp-Asp-Asp) domain-containing protein
MKNTLQTLNCNSKFLFSSGIALGFCLLTSSAPSAHASLEEGRFPYKDTMVVSAYYSPLPDQEHYATGSYEGDIRLNGGGVRGASGAEVYPGMIAAPREYPFGFKMNIPGIGTVAVQDRGGAIKGNRLDVWMGHGDEGLRRALNWGKRTVEVEMFGVNPEVKESVYLQNFFQAEITIRETAKVTRMFPEDIWYQSEGEQVKKLQEVLKVLGYFQDEIDGFYGDSTLQAVYDFQLKNGIVSSPDDLGAGHCGVQTRALLERQSKFQETKKTNTTTPDSPKEISINPRNIFFSRDLKLGDSGADVVALQRELKTMNLILREPNGIYDEVTQHAVFKFQQRQNIVKNKSDAGAGVFGPTTRSKISAVVTTRENRNTQIANAKTNPQIAESNSLIARDLEFGQNDSQVKNLQNLLKKTGYFQGAITGFFGMETQKALIAFQLDKKIVANESAQGAGRVGPKTRSVLNSL